MAIIHGGFERLKIKYPNIDFSKVVIVAWGAGQYFTDYYPIFNIPVKYTICPNESNWGNVIHGVRVVSPDVLKNENPNFIFIIIFSASSNEIMNQIRGWGNFSCARSFNFGTYDNSIVNELSNLSSNKLNFPPSKSSNYSDVGFFYQGPIFEYTELALAYQRFKFPNDYHCLATDAYQDPVLIEKCARWVDDVIEISPPKKQGVLRRNLMIKTAYQGAVKINQKKIKYCVRVRSGNIVVGDVSKFILDYFYNDNINAKKIGFYMGWSWKNVPFHISDAFMVARTKDMINLWGIDEDEREETDILALNNSTIHFSELSKATNEAYLWSNYAKSEGFRTESIHDYYKFMVERLIPLEPLVTTYSLKHIPVFNLEYDSSFSPDIFWWNSLKNNFDAECAKGLARYTSNCSIQEFWRSKLG